MNWKQENGFMICSIKLDELVLYGSFRFLNVNQKIANAVLFDNVSKVFRFGYVIKTENLNLDDTYTFKCGVQPKFKKSRQNTAYIKEWCFNQKLN